MKKNLQRLILSAVLLAFAPTVALAGTSVWSRVTDTTNCQNVTTTAVEVLDADLTRTKWAILTTTGAATIYFRQGGTAVAKAAASAPLVAGQSYSEEAGSVYTGAVSAITASGTAWVCTKEAVNP